MWGGPPQNKIYKLKLSTLMAETEWNLSCIDMKFTVILQHLVKCFQKKVGGIRI